MAENTGYELGWDSEVENDGQGFQVLPAGVYDFEVTKLERARHDGKGKIPPCAKAIVTLALSDGENAGQTTENLFLYSTMEWKLCEFFVACGLRQKGERVAMPWHRVVGSRGRCKLGIRKWMNDKGEERESNQVTEYLVPEVKPAAQAAPAGGWKPGTF